MKPQKETWGSYFITQKWGAILNTKSGTSAGENVFISNDLHKIKMNYSLKFTHTKKTL